MCTICYTGFLEQAGTIAHFLKTRWQSDIKDERKRKQTQDALIAKLEAAGIDVAQLSEQLEDGTLDTNSAESEIFRAILRYEHLMALDKKCQDFVNGLKFGQLSEMTGEDGLNRAYMRYMAANRDGISLFLRKLRRPVEKTLREEDIRLQRVGVLIKRRADQMGRSARRSFKSV